MKTELLSPAGSPMALRAAVQNGADAIYLGEKSFSARKNAANFTWDEIKASAKYCHTRGVKIYLTLNTLISESELAEFEKTILKCAESGIDAIIVQDLGAADIIKKVCPDMPIHASTQLTACNEYDVNELQKRGFTRDVLSRELSENEIKTIHENTDVELEAFCHGALCISLSGRCLMSSFIGGRSGNRGNCAQPCRKLYSYKGRSGYFLSPRDLCLADELASMKNAGVFSFKIEGRMKSPEYVATVTNVYRKYLDSASPLLIEDEDRLKKIFVRGDGFTKAYFKGINTPQMMNYDISNDKITQRADDDILKEARHSYRDGVENKKIPVYGYLEVSEGANSLFRLTDDDKNSVEAYGANGEKALNLPLTAEYAKERMGKLGQTPFELKGFECSIENGTTLSAAALNALRRDCAEKLAYIRGEIKVLDTYPYTFPQIKNNANSKKPKLYAQITFPHQFEAVKDADKILVPLSIWGKITPNEKCVLVLPQVITDISQFEKWMGKITLPKEIYLSSLGIISYFKDKNISVCSDFGMNIYNPIAAESLNGVCKSITLSPELMLSDIKNICTRVSLPCEVLAYGKQAVMTSRACLIRGITGKCDCSSPIEIADQTGAKFTILGDKISHLNTVLNSRPTFMADKLIELEKTGVYAIRLVFTDEDSKTTKNIMEMYRKKAQIVKPQLYTRGYFMKS